jgi:hypothetical protein
MTRRAIDWEKLRVALRRLSRGHLLVMTERAIQRVPRAKLAKGGDDVRGHDQIDVDGGAGASMDRHREPATDGEGNAALVQRLDDLAKGLVEIGHSTASPLRADSTAPARHHRDARVIQRKIAQERTASRERMRSPKRESPSVSAAGFGGLTSGTSSSTRGLPR